jgi:murein DD-endopeptidase MepM/ murein hydrolase activator NlpD
VNPKEGAIMTQLNATNLRFFLEIAALLVAGAALSACATRHTDYPPAPASYFIANVNPGDSVFSLSERYQVNADDIVALNDLQHGDRILAGDTIRVPAYGHLRDPSYGPKAEAKHQAGAPAEVPVPQPRPLRARAARAAPANPARSWWDGWMSPYRSAPMTDQNFVWPVKGRILSPFGGDGGGERNDGINISAPRGAPIRAAADGIVSYVGNELKGYGNLVLIRHDNGYVTAYAHADSVIVERGQRVSQGQTIGYAGSTGDVDRPQVHFEIRQGTKPVDPRRYLTTTS